MSPCCHGVFFLLFDCSLLKVGDGSVISGLDEGVIGTCIGEGRRIIIPPASGFGKTGSLDGTIPPNATVIYDIQVLGAALCWPRFRSV